MGIFFGLYFVQTVSLDSNLNRLLMVEERAEVSRDLRENCEKGHMVFISKQIN